MFNNIVMMGRLVADPELKHTPNGVAVCSFRIAVNQKYVRKGDERKTDFFNIICWRSIAEFVAKHFAKGRMILVRGELQTRQFTDKNGNPATWYEILAEQVEFTGEKNTTAGNNAENDDFDNAPAPSVPNDAPPSPDDDDYPF